MCKIKELARLGCSHWYVRLGLAVAVGLWLLICSFYGLGGVPADWRNSLSWTIIDSLDRKCEHLRPGIFKANWDRVHASKEKFVSLASLEYGIKEWELIIDR